RRHCETSFDVVHQFPERALPSGRKVNTEIFPCPTKKKGSKTHQETYLTVLRPQKKTATLFRLFGLMKQCGSQ
ncbi:MAG: hypothetical protein R6U66_14015, partial [Bacteroidales bacterium]